MDKSRANLVRTEAMQDRSDKSGVSINLDPQVGDKGNTPITATFRNSSLRDALLVVTEMARLKFAVLGDSIYVTTPDHAISLEKEEKSRPKRPAPRSVEAAE